jgi:glycosyltransferase involved in cell wall biosynthesis
VRILYLIDSLVAGGAEQSLVTLAPEYARHDLDLDVAYLYERDNVLRPALEAADVPVHSVAGAGGRVGSVRRVRRLLRTQRPTLLHTTLFDSDVIGRCASVATGIPVVSSLVNEMYGAEQLRNPRIRRSRLRAAQFVDAATARRVTRFHAVSEYVANVMARRLHIRRGRIDVIPRGRDPAALGRRSASRRERARAHLCARAEHELLLAVGRHEYQKGFDVLLRTFAVLHRARPMTRLLFAGRDGNATSELHAAAIAHGVSDAVTFLGYRRDVPDLLCAADVYVAPSRWEGSPGGVIEAMALEIPIVASDIPTMREVLGPGELAQFAAPDDADGLLGAITTALDESQALRTTAARARFLEKYTVAAVAGQMLGFYERALRDRA